MNGSNPYIVHGDGKRQPFLTVMNATQLCNLQFFFIKCFCFFILMCPYLSLFFFQLSFFIFIFIFLFEKKIGKYKDKRDFLIASILDLAFFIKDRACFFHKHTRLIFDCNMRDQFPPTSLSLKHRQLPLVNVMIVVIKTVCIPTCMHSALTVCMHMQRTDQIKRRRLFLFYFFYSSIFYFI